MSAYSSSFVARAQMTRARGLGCWFFCPGCETGKRWKEIQGTYDRGMEARIVDRLEQSRREAGAAAGIFAALTLVFAFLFFSGYVIVSIETATTSVWFRVIDHEARVPYGSGQLLTSALIVVDDQKSPPSTACRMILPQYLTNVKAAYPVDSLVEGHYWTSCKFGAPDHLTFFYVAGAIVAGFFSIAVFAAMDFYGLVCVLPRLISERQRALAAVRRAPV